MAVYLSTLQQLLYPALLIFLFVGSLFAILVGAGMVFRTEATFRLFGSMNRWVSTRKALRPIEIPRKVEIRSRWGQRLLGIVFLLGAAISAVALAKGFDVAAVAGIFGGSVPPVVRELVAQVVKWLLLAGNAFAMLAGIMLLFLPDAFARLAALSDRWYSSRRHDRDWDAVHLTFDDWVRASPRAAGWIIIVLALFVVLNLGGIIFGHR